MPSKATAKRAKHARNDWLCGLCGLGGCFLMLLVLTVGRATAASLHDPALRFRTTRTPHFIVYFHQGEDDTARRLAAIAEDTW